MARESLSKTRAVEQAELRATESRLSISPLSRRLVERLLFAGCLRHGQAHAAAQIVEQELELDAGRCRSLHGIKCPRCKGIGYDPPESDSVCQRCEGNEVVESLEPGETSEW